MKNILIFAILLFVTPLCLAENSGSVISDYEAFQKSLPGSFSQLVKMRERIELKKSSINSEIIKLQQEKQFLPRTVVDIDNQIKSLSMQIERSEQEVSELEAKPAKSQEDELRIRDLKSYISSDKAYLIQQEDSKNRLKRLLDELNGLANDITGLNEELRPIESKIADLLNIEEERNYFRSWISISFCVLVAIVILGFYFIAYQKESIAESIFSGEKGIQFVSIFLIVIAVILFGIMGILESKELSALLGGLSGYILGRVSNSNSQPVPTNSEK